MPLTQHLECVRMMRPSLTAATCCVQLRYKRHCRKLHVQCETWIQVTVLAAIPAAHGLVQKIASIDTRMARASRNLALLPILVVSAAFLCLLPQNLSWFLGCKLRWPCYQHMSTPVCTLICMENSIVEQTLVAECRNPSPINCSCFSHILQARVRGFGWCRYSRAAQQI